MYANGLRRIVGDKYIFYIDKSNTVKRFFIYQNLFISYRTGGQREKSRQNLRDYSGFAVIKNSFTYNL